MFLAQDQDGATEGPFPTQSTAKRRATLVNPRFLKCQGVVIDNVKIYLAKSYGFFEAYAVKPDGNLQLVGTGNNRSDAIDNMYSAVNFELVKQEWEQNND